MKGKKHDEGKPRYDLMDSDFEEGVACAVTHGASLYGDYNWENVDQSRFYAALRRHIREHRKGMRSKKIEDFVDKKSGLMHLDHAASCLMFLRAFALRDSPELQKQVETDIEGQLYAGELKWTT